MGIENNLYDAKDTIRELKNKKKKLTKYLIISVLLNIGIITTLALNEAGLLNMR